MTIRYGSVCSGVEAATAAWHGLGWQPQWFSEIEKFPSAVLKHHYPDVPNLGDMTKLHESDIFNDRPIDLLVGGTPCQSFSVAGLRKGMADPRGNLALTYLALAATKRPRWVVWENVPGVLSSNKGRDFGAFLGGLEQLGYGVAYRVLDAQYFGVAQRRRRVFVVGYFGDWRPAAAVLFEPHSLQGHPPPSRKAGAPVAALTATGVGTCGADDNQAKAGHIVAFDPTQITSAHNRSNPQPGDPCHTLAAQANAPAIAHTLTARYDSSPDGTSRVLPLVAARMTAFGEYTEDGTASTVKARDYKDATDLIAFHASQDPISGDVVPALGVKCTMGVANVSSYGIRTANTSSNGWDVQEEVTHTLDLAAPPAIFDRIAVRRLTPRECERLQDFPDDYTLIKPNTPDGPRYKSMGNSMCRAVMKWIGSCIDTVDRLLIAQQIGLAA